MRIARYVFYSMLVVAVVGFSFSRHTYSADCLACLQQASGVEKAILGITYSRSEKQRPHAGTAYDPISNLRVISPLDPRLYQEITGRCCEHQFVRRRFLRQYEFRKSLTENLYRCYLRVADRDLARETLTLIDQLYPINLTKNPASPGISPPNQYAVSAGSLPNEPLSILYRGLALAGDPAEWRQVLDAARAGDGSLKLLIDPAGLARRLDNPDPGIRYQVIDQLAALKDPGAWATIAGCLQDPHMRNHATRKIVFSGHIEFYEAVFKADEKERVRVHVKEDDPVGYTPEIFDQLIVKYSADEIRSLVRQGNPYLDRIGFAAIRRQNRFEFLEEVLALLNERPSPAAVRTIESLLQGPTPFEAGMRYSDLPRLDPWADLVKHTNMTPVESLTNYTKLGKKSILERQEIVRLGIQRDPAKWGELRDLYIHEIQSPGGASCAAIAQAMAGSDRAKTLEFLLSQLDLDYSRVKQTTAAIAGLGAIADPTSLAPLSAFLKTGAGTSIEWHPYYQPVIAYALHRCRGFQRWRLVKGPGSIYSIEKQVERSRN